MVFPRAGTVSTLVAVASLQTVAASAQGTLPQVAAQDSMFTTQGAPQHLLLDARNPLPRPVPLRVVAVEHLPPGGAAVPLRRPEVLVGTDRCAAACVVPTGYHDTVTVFFDTVGVSPNLDRYRFRVRGALGGRIFVLYVTVSRGTRHPVHR
jgi:hypothetical protein